MDKAQAYFLAPKCQHLTPSDKCILNATDSTEQSAPLNSERTATLDINVAYSTASAGTPCRAIAVKGFSYCRSHIKLHSDEYERFIATQLDAPRRAKRKYNFADPDLRTRYAEKVSTGAKLYDLREDIALLSCMLEDLLNAKDKGLSDKSVLRIIDLQRRCLATMNDIRKANIKTFTQDKLDTFLTRIATIINQHAPDKQQLIGIELLAVSKEYSEDSQDK